MGEEQLPLKLVITDMDGTLLPKNKVLTARTCDAIRQLEKAGITLCLASARPPEGMMRYIHQLHLTSICAGFNGGVIFAPHKQIFENITLSLGLVYELIDKVAAYPVEIWLQGHKKWLVEDKTTSLVKHEYEVTDVEPTQVANLRENVLPVNRVVAMGRDPEVLIELERTLNTHFQGRISALRSNPLMLDITAPEATKGHAVRKIAELYNILPIQVATLGDADNDISLLKAAGVGIAMGQAPQTVKEAASFVTASNEEEGWAKAIEQFVLPAAS